MSAIDISKAPYYDRYHGANSAHRKNGYTMVLAKPGLAEQASEFNEIQSIQRDYLERLGNAILRDGSIVSGCEININGRVVTIEPGRIFLEGLVREFDGATLQITGVGNEFIVAYLETSLITEDDDSTLRDPAQGAENYGMAGAHRESQILKIAVIEEDDLINGTVIGPAAQGSQITKLVDGGLLKEEKVETSPSLLVSDTLARRTYDENGNFKVEGMNLRALVESEGTGLETHVKLYISEGKSYVRGYEIHKPSMSFILLRPATDTRFVQSESHYYSSTIQKYELTNGPVASVQNLTCLVAVTGERKYRGNIAGGFDPLNYTPVDNITRVYTKDSSGNITKTFVPGRDYKLYNDQVDWSLMGDNAEEPDKGSTYYVDYVYNKTMILGTDYGIENTESKAYLKFLDGGAKPGDNSRMYISYNYTLARRDLILLDAEGNISVLEGIPDKLNNLITPYNGSDAYLELGYVDIYPMDMVNSKPSNPNLAKVVNYEGVRLTQEEIYKLLQRVETIEDNLATLDLERAIENSEPSNELKGYFVDNFKDTDKCDISYVEELDSGELRSFTACLDGERGEISTSYDMRSTDLVVNDKTSDEHAVYGQIISAPYVEEIALQQKYATGTMRVNPYASYGPMCQVVLDPKIDNWVDENTLKVHNTLNDTVYDTAYNTVTRWVRNGHSRGTFEGSSTSTTTTRGGTTTATTTSTSISKRYYEYMRQRVVSVKGTAFTNGMKNIYATFNNIPISLIASAGTTQGQDRTVNGKTYKTVNANDTGSFQCTFTVPANVPCGSVEVKFTAVDDAGDEYTGTAVYQAQGTILTTTITNTTVITQHYTVLQTTTNTYSSDPLAQSFMLSDTKDMSLMSLGLYFAKKATNRPVIVQVRNVVNGYPGETVYAEVSVDPSEINIPSNPLVPVVTKVTLNQPVYCRAGTYYCFVVLSDSNAYEMYYAEMGQNLLGKTEQMTINPYATGVMFSSSNASTWTAHQGADLKFELYKSRFTGSGTIIFDDVEISSSEITGLLLDAAYEDNNNNGLVWYYRYLISGNIYSDWMPIDTLVYRDLQAETSKVSLKAVITTDFSTSPYIDAGRVSLRSFIDAKDAVYISKHLTQEDFDEEYQSLKISYQAALPQGASHRVFYMDEMYGEWIELIEYSGENSNVSLELKPVDEEFVQYTWNVNKVNCMLNGHSPAGSRFFKLRIDLSTTLRYNRPRIRKMSSIFKYNY